MIEVINLEKSFGKDKRIIKNTSWTAHDGDITGFIGLNGAGKTTTLKMMTGVLSPDNGTVKLNGFDITKQPLQAKQQYGYVSDSPDHFLKLKGIEYLNYMADIYETPIEGREKFITEYAKRFGIYDALNSTILSYSHGMRQKIMIMGVLIHEPKIWILDEPMTGLDPESAYELKKIMREHANKGNAVLFSTHVLEVAEKLCDRVIMIKSGEIMFEGTLNELKSKFPEGTSLEDIFLKMNGDK